ncbi:diguanylate cyclase [Sphingobium naphthae]|uniref:diguanylate cyclase n=1 Tax=Sphingobium naphthae TaxID=1886786 RepID=A0ABU4A0S0_9SPHN|nr:diguanylate cyclase [Sphingobium naphthae]MDV5825182.1 diguanylate cyclase [Sphingobium naphthae]
MVASLSSRVRTLCLILCLLLVALAALLLDASYQMNRSLRWVTHSSQVLRTATQALTELQAAESGQRGFTLTRNPEFAAGFDAHVASAQASAARLVRLTADNPAQNSNARAIQTLTGERIDNLRTTARLARAGDFDGARASTASGRGRATMALIGARTDMFLTEERALATSRMETVDRRLNFIRLAVLGGTPIALLFIAIMAIALVRRIKGPVRAMVQVMGDLGSGDRSARIEAAMQSREFERLAEGYNAMASELETAVADQVRSEEQLRVANLELSRNATILQARGEVIELLGGMAHRMQAARTDEELAAIIHAFVPRVLPGIPGALYAHNNSRNLLVPIAAWEGMEIDPTGFPPDQCWALRRGRSHSVDDADRDIVCGHVAPEGLPYHCEPLLAGGEVIGVLYLNRLIDAESQFRLTLLGENIASALVNHRLQRGLREQTIRDPLTGLFNRRYMEEALALEIARASRSRTTLSVVMCDVDHFKRFNDEFGHDAGDAVLQAVAAEMRQRFRDGDVVCRYGGEEFTIIAPGSTAVTLAQRVEIVRQAISELKVSQNGQALGSMTMSFGIASWDESMSREGSALIHAADAALYRAKREGRNRVVLAEMRAIAAE